MATDSDVTPGGTKIEGAYENDRNAENADLFKAIIREACGVCDVIIGHHMVYVVEEKRPDGFTYQIVQEIPSADCLIFDHTIAKKIWGANWAGMISQLACTPPEHRDALLRTLYFGRTHKPS